jgi:hypothetical protein
MKRKKSKEIVLNGVQEWRSWRCSRGETLVKIDSYGSPHPAAIGT